MKRSEADQLLSLLFFAHMYFTLFLQGSSPRTTFYVKQILFIHADAEDMWLFRAIIPDMCIIYRWTGFNVKCNVSEGCQLISQSRVYSFVQLFSSLPVHFKLAPTLAKVEMYPKSLVLVQFYGPMLMPQCQLYAFGKTAKKRTQS